MRKGTSAGIIVALFAGAALGYGLFYFLPRPSSPPSSGTIAQTKFSSLRTLAYLNDGSTSPTQVPDTQLSITTGGGSYLVVRFTTTYVIYLFQNHDGLTRFQINLTMNDETICLKYIETSSDGAVASASGLEDGGGLELEFVTEPLPAGTYTFKIIWRSTISTGSTDSQCIFCTPNHNSTRSFFIQEIRI